MMRRFLFSTLIALVAACQAQAAAFKEAELKVMEPQLRAKCLGQTDRYNWMTPEQHSAACSCISGKTTAGLRKLSFTDTRTPTAPDKKKFMDVMQAASTTCTAPAFRTQTAARVRKECKAQAPSVNIMRDLKPARVDKMCGCVAERFSRTWTLPLVEKFPDAPSMMAGSRGLFAESIAACAGK